MRPGTVKSCTYLKAGFYQEHGCSANTLGYVSALLKSNICLLEMHKHHVVEYTNEMTTACSNRRCHSFLGDDMRLEKLGYIMYTITNMLSEISIRESKTGNSTPHCGERNTKLL